MARKITLDFLKTEAAAGTVLGLAALAALIVANSPWASGYFGWLKSEHLVAFGPLRIEESVSGWIKEGLMAVFFLIVGLEIKYEILKGELSDPKRLAAPVLAALGGMIAPALVYLAVAPALGGPVQGWPIPLATDIAFALAVFALVGKGLPPSLRVFLLTLAIVDDLGAIALIGLLFSQGVQMVPLLIAAGVLGAVALLARWRLVIHIWTVAFFAVWALWLESGLSTSLMGVAFALIVPVNPRGQGREAPLFSAMHGLHPYVAYLILPLFAFAKAGVAFGGLTLEQLLAPLVVAIALGLFLGKQIGVFGFAWLAARLGLGAKPSGATWLQVYGVSLLCGVGFTMSLFIGALAFPGAADSAIQAEVKLGVLGGSLLSALAGATVLAFAAGRPLKDLSETAADTVAE